MRFYLLSDNTDTLLGMRLAGIAGEVIHQQEELESRITQLAKDKEIGIILVTNKLMELSHDFIYDIKLHTKQPLILEVSDRHGGGSLSQSITRYVQEAVGISI